MEKLILELNILQMDEASPQIIANFAKKHFSEKEIAELKNYSTSSMGDAVIIAIHDLL